jgi:hypothetical protein
MKIKFGTHYLLTIRESERDRVRSFYEGPLGCELQAHDHGVTSNIPENIDLFHFSDGEVLGVQYVNDRAPVIEAAGHKLACWMELKTDDVTGLVGKLNKFGVDEIRDFWDKEHFYFHAPGGQVFRVIELDE